MKPTPSYIKVLLLVFGWLPIMVVAIVIDMLLASGHLLDEWDAQRAAQFDAKRTERVIEQSYIEAMQRAAESNIRQSDLATLVCGQDGWFRDKRGNIQCVGPDGRPSGFAHGSYQ